uniref:Uncharacterized protein n=1 Tax=Quercus lobata TaxID=97700 RepID=A0A7N2LJK0_QUELO
MSFQPQNFPGISKALGTQSVISRLAPLLLLHNKTQQQQPFPQNPFTCTRRRFDCLSIIFPKMSSWPVPAFALDSNGDCTNPKNQSISKLVSKLRTAYWSKDFDRVEEILVARETKLK